jgi:hypothetical protein
VADTHLSTFRRTIIALLCHSGDLPLNIHQQRKAEKEIYSKPHWDVISVLFDEYNHITGQEWVSMVFPPLGVCSKAFHTLLLPHNKRLGKQPLGTQ